MLFALAPVLLQNTECGVSDADEIENDSSGGVMSSYFKAILIDFDGTMTEGGRPHERLLDSLREARDSGMRLVLVTGRVVTDLLHVFPDAERWFDVIVAENGAVIRRNGVSHALTAPVPLELDESLVAQGVHFQRGQVLLACSSEDELVVLREIRRLETDCQLIRTPCAENVVRWRSVAPAD